VRRREFIAMLAGVTVAPVRVASAQQPIKVRSIGLLMMYPENDPQGQVRANVFRRELEKAGWAIGRDLQITYHWGTGDADWVQSAISTIEGQAPDVLLANGDAAANAARRLVKTVPVIFIASGDPVGDGLVQSLARPGANLTGFAVMEPSLGTKLLEMLKQVAPRVARVGVLVNPDSVTHKRIFSLLKAAARTFSVEVEWTPVRETNEIETAITKWGKGSNYGVIVPSDPSTNSHRGLIIEIAGRHQLPVIYALRAAAADGGLMSYGVDIPDLFRRSALYADRILKGEKPTDLPVQLPTKYELVINLKTAKAFDLNVPVSLLTTADEVIE
jgi:putative ABC transport system substrate-binding protein